MSCQKFDNAQATLHCFKTVCMRNKQIVLLKDTWRVLWPTSRPEHETYKKLHANGIQNIPQCSDVGGDDPNHRTQTKDRADRYNPNLTLREFQHHRIALEHMDRALEDFTDVRQMVSAIRDAAEAHRQAVVLANTLHRDVCVGNIIMRMKDGEYKGFLIDWDLCLDLTRKGGAQLERTSTWQFTAIRLQEEPKDHETLVAERVDGVESFLHVLMWMALRYTAHSLILEHLSSLLDEYFDSSYYAAGGKRYTTRTRASFMITRILLNEAEFTNKGIRSVLWELSRTLCQRYVWLRLYPCDTSKSAITLYQYSIQLRDKALEILQKDDAWLPNLLTEILEDPTEWEVDNEKVAHVIVDPHLHYYFFPGKTRRA